MRHRSARSEPGRSPSRYTRERAPHRGAEEILPTVDSTSAEGGPHELFHEFLAQIFDVALVGTRCDGFCPHALQLVSLADVRRDADNAGIVAFLQPGDDNGGIQPT